MQLEKRYYFGGTILLIVSTLSLVLGWSQQLLDLCPWEPLRSWSWTYLPQISWWHFPLTILATALSLRLSVYYQLLDRLGRAILCLTYPTITLLSCSGLLWQDALLSLLPIGWYAMMLSTFREEASAHVYLPLGICTVACTLSLGIEYLALIPLFLVGMLSIRAWSLRNVLALLWGIFISLLLLAPALYLLLGIEASLTFLERLPIAKLGGVQAYSHGLFVGHRFVYLALTILSYLCLIALQAQWMRRQSIRLRACYALLTASSALVLVFSLIFGQILGGFTLLLSLPYSLLLSSHLSQGNSKIYRYIIPIVALILALLTLIP